MKRPNFLVFITDQQRWDHVGFAGNPTIRTPNIDALASAGTWVPRFYVASPVCMPNRATFMTGRMPSLHGVRHNGIPLDFDQSTFVHLLRGAGYRTALIGKSHLQNFVGEAPAYERESFAPLAVPPPADYQEAFRARHIRSSYDQELRSVWRADPGRYIELPYYGFDHVRLCVGHGDNVSGHFENWLHTTAPTQHGRYGCAHALEQRQADSPQTYKPVLSEAVYPTTYVEQETLAFLDDHRSSAAETPFFIQCSFPDPHHPFTPPGRYWDMYSPDEVVLPESFFNRANHYIPPIEHLVTAHRVGETQTRWTTPFIANEAQARDIIAKTYGQITMIDDAVGAVLKRLCDNGLANDTVICFVSDHGDWMGDHGLFLKGPFHYQSLIRTPFVWRDPDNKFNRGRLPGLAGTVDLARTILERAGLQPFNGIQGRSLLSALSGANSFDDRQMLIEQQTQYPYLGFDRLVRVNTLVSQTRRLSVWENCAWGELYDLDNDPGERVNLWDEPSWHTQRAELTLSLVHLMQSHQDLSPYPLDKG